MVSKSGEKNSMMGLQIMHSGPLIPSNATDNVTSFPQRGIYPSHNINYSFHSLSLQPPLQNKSFLLKLWLKQEKSASLHSDSFQQNTCRGPLVTDCVVGAWHDFTRIDSTSVNPINYMKNVSKYVELYKVHSIIVDFQSSIYLTTAIKSQGF